VEFNHPTSTLPFPHSRKRKKRSFFPAKRRMNCISGTIQYSPSIMDVSGHQPAYFYNSWLQRTAVIACQRFSSHTDSKCLSELIHWVCSISTANTHAHTHTHRQTDHCLRKLCAEKHAGLQVRQAKQFFSINDLFANFATDAQTVFPMKSSMLKTACYWFYGQLFHTTNNTKGENTMTKDKLNF